MPASHQSVFYRPDARPVAQPTASKPEAAEPAGKAQPPNDGVGAPCTLPPTLTPVDRNKAYCSKGHSLKGAKFAGSVGHPHKQHHTIAQGL